MSTTTSTSEASDARTSARAARELKASTQSAHKGARRPGSAAEKLHCDHGGTRRALLARRASASLIVLATLAFASPAQAQTTNTIWSSWVLLKAHESESSLPGYGADYPNSILLRDEFVYDHTTFRVTTFYNLKNLSYVYIQLRATNARPPRLIPSTATDSEWYRKTRNWKLHIGSETLAFSTQQLTQVSTGPYYTVARVGFNSSAFNTANSPFANGARLNLKITVPAPSSVPGAPRNLAAVGGNNGKVNLSWQPPSSGGRVITRYRYRYSAGSAVSSSASWIDVPDSSDLGRDGGDEYLTTVRGLANATQYAFELQAVNGAGAGAKTAPVTATPTLPPKPQLLSATGHFSTVTLTYDRALNASSGLAASDFTTSVPTVPARYTQPTAPDVTGIEVSGSTVVLTMEDPYPLVDGYIFTMRVKLASNLSRLQAQGGTQADNSCGQPHIGFERVSHSSLIGCKWVIHSGDRTVSRSYTGTGVPVTLTSGNLGQLVAAKSGIKDVQITEAGSDNQWTNGETVDITVTFHGEAKIHGLRGGHKPRLPTPGWCRTGGGVEDATYESGNNTDSLLFRCQIFNGPHTTLRVEPKWITDHDSLHIKVNGKIEAYGHDYNVRADTRRYGTVVKHATSSQVEAPSIIGAPTLSGSGDDGAWTADEAVEVSLTFSEAVTVGTTGGTPTVGLTLGSTEIRNASYLRGSGSTVLVFGYTLTGTDGSHTSLLVPVDSLALNGGTIRSEANDTDATISHSGAAVIADPVDENQEGRNTRDDDDETPFTASFSALPQTHNGSDAFTFELRFSEAPEGLSYTTVAGGLLTVTGATVNKARRLTGGSNLAWEVTATPSQRGDITIRLPARACTDANAVCIGERALARAASATVPGVALTASFSSLPAEHDGQATFDVRFHLSEEPGTLSYRTVQHGLFEVTNGSVDKASRLRAGKSNGWALRVTPTGTGDVSLRVKGTTACTTAPAVCTSDGRKLAGGLEVTIAGPATLSVADAQVREAADAALTFTVSLSRARSGATTVAYATSDGTATAGSDYTSTSGTLTFTGGQTRKTVSVPVLDDAHDEGSETMILTLSSASGAQLGDGEATGTITNSDPMPMAWMVRFGRTIAGNVVDALDARLASSGASHVTMGGMQFDAQSLGGPMPTGTADNSGPVLTMSADELLRTSAFHLSSEGKGAGGAGFAAWGKVSTGGFDAKTDGMALDGSVTSALLSADAELGNVLGGIMVSRSSGNGDYAFEEAAGNDEGNIKSTLTGVYPYARLQMSEQISAWAIAGLGSGDLTLERNSGERLKTDLSMRLGALGVRANLLEATDGLALNLKSDALWVDMESDVTQGLIATQGESTRLRLLLEGERAFSMGEIATLTPSAEFGIRLDGGDAESGAGIEAGAGLQYSAGALSIEGSVRTLLAHQQSGYDEWGASAALRLSPSASGRGLSLTLSPTWGNAASATQRLWSARDASALGFNDEPQGQRQLEGELAYGWALSHERGLLSPYARFSLGAGKERTMRGGARWQLGSAHFETELGTSHEERRSATIMLQSSVDF